MTDADVTTRTALVGARGDRAPWVAWFARIPPRLRCIHRPVGLLGLLSPEQFGQARDPAQRCEIEHWQWIGTEQGAHRCVDRGVQGRVFEDLVVQESTCAFDGDSVLVAVQLPTAGRGNRIEVRGEPGLTGVQGDMPVPIVGWSALTSPLTCSRGVVRGVLLRGIVEPVMLEDSSIRRRRSSVVMVLRSVRAETNSRESYVAHSSARSGSWTGRCP